MDIAAAMAQIQSVMSAPDAPVPIVVLRASGKKEEIVADQRKLAEILGGTPTVVGAVNALTTGALQRVVAAQRWPAAARCVAGHC